MSLENTFGGSTEGPKWVSFRIIDLFHPSPEEILTSITPDLVIRGKIVSFTDSGENRSAYAVVEVEGISRAIVVPVSKLRHE